MSASFFLQSGLVRVRPVRPKVTLERLGQIKAYETEDDLPCIDEQFIVAAGELSVFVGDPLAPVEEPFQSVLAYVRIFFSSHTV